MSKNILHYYNYGNNTGVGSDENCVYHHFDLVGGEDAVGVYKEGKERKRSSSEKKSKILQLRFKYSCINRMPDVVYTGIPIGREGSSIEVVLIDVLSGKAVKSGSEASAKVEILVLKNAFDKNDDTDTWTAKEFEACILGGRYGKASLLARTRINLTEGCGSLNDIFFSHTKHPLPNIEVRLGARIIQGMGFCHGAARIREAVSSPFKVKDRRAINKNDRKLSHTDKVWRLKNIGKNGLSHKNLSREGIEEVGHFLNMHMEDPEKLKNILSKAMSPEKLMTTINHAITCEYDRIPLETNHDDSKLIIDCKDSFQEPFDILRLETTLEPAFCEDEFLWNRIDTDTIIRTSCNNKHQQILDHFDPFQSSIFCSSADLQNVLQCNVPLHKAQSQKRWKVLFSIFRWLSIGRVVRQKQSVLGIKRCRQE